MNKITSVCVYCASSTKIDSAYFEAARELGTLLGQRHIRLINGAGGIGLMSATADAVLAAGGEVTGVIPVSYTHLIRREKECCHLRIPEPVPCQFPALLWA